MANQEKPVQQKTLPASLVSAISKAVRNYRTPSTTRIGEHGERNIELVRGDWLNIAGRRGRQNNDNKKIVELLPDLKRCLSILVPAIISPGDMLTTNISYSGPENLISSELSAMLLQIIEDYFNETYDIKDKLTNILTDIIAYKGSHVIMTLPETAIDAVINGNSVSTESFAIKNLFSNGYIKPVGNLGEGYKKSPENKTNVSTESLFFEKINTASSSPGVHLTVDGFLEHDKYVTVVDNPDVFKLPNLRKNMALDKVDIIKSNGYKSLVNLGVESFNSKEMSTGSKLRQVDRAIFNRVRNNSLKEIVAIPNSHTFKRKSVGAPLIITCPSESVLPVHMPGDFTKHIGYFVLIDNNGNILDLSTNQAHCTNMENNLRANQGVGSDIIKKIDANMHASANKMGNSVDYVSQIYSEMVERDLIERVSNGTGISNLSVATNNDFYRIMLARFYANQFTQLAYVPAEYITYMAFDYDENGIGKSLLDGISVINTLRVVLMFNDIMASVKNSIGRTKAKVHIDESDPNPMKTAEILMDEIVKSRAINLPMSVTDPADIITFIQRAGYEWEFEGNPKLPTTSIDFENKSSTIVKSDEALSDNLRKMTALAFGIPPEMVDNSFNSEFAVTSIMNNTLFIKQAMTYQNMFVSMLKLHHTQVIRADDGLLSKLRAAIAANKTAIKVKLTDLAPTLNQEQLTEEVEEALLIMATLNDFISNLKLELPQPPSVTLEKQLEELKAYSDSLDTGIAAYLSGDFMTDDTSGEVSGQIATYAAMIKAHMLRKFMVNKNILPELSELVTLRENGDPCLNILEEAERHIEAMTKAGVLIKSKLDANKNLANGASGNDSSEESTSDESTSDDTTTTDDVNEDNADDVSGTGSDDTPEDNPEGTDPEENESATDSNEDGNSNPEDDNDANEDNENFPT
jgi:hypothetical protein